MKHPVLFLDIDGVMLPYGRLQKFNEEFIAEGMYASSRLMLYPPDFDQKAKDNLHRIIAETGCKIVLSSAWRDCSNHDYNERIFKDRNIECDLIGATPMFGYSKRMSEILWFVSRYGIRKFAVVDDDSDVVDPESPNVFICNPQHGLTDSIADRIINHLKDGEI